MHNICSLTTSKEVLIEKLKIPGCSSPAFTIHIENQIEEQEHVAIQIHISMSTNSINNGFSNVSPMPAIEDLASVVITVAGSKASPLPWSSLLDMLDTRHERACHCQVEGLTTAVELLHVSSHCSP